MTGARRPAGRDGEVAAAYASGLSLRAVAAKFGIGRNGATGAIERAGTPLRKTGRPAKIAADAVVKQRYADGHGTNTIARDLGVSPGTVGRALKRDGTEIRSRAESARLRWQREAEKRGEYPWAAEAAERHRAGEPVRRLAREYGAGARTVKAAIGRQGVTVTRDPRGRRPGGAA